MWSGRPSHEGVNEQIGEQQSSASIWGDVLSRGQGAWPVREGQTPLSSSSVGASREPRKVENLTLDANVDHLLGSTEKLLSDESTPSTAENLDANVSIESLMAAHSLAILQLTQQQQLMHQQKLIHQQQLLQAEILGSRRGLGSTDDTTALLAALGSLAVSNDNQDLHQELFHPSQSIRKSAAGGEEFQHAAPFQPQPFQLQSSMAPTPLHNLHGFQPGGPPPGRDNNLPEGWGSHRIQSLQSLPQLKQQQLLQQQLLLLQQQNFEQGGPSTSTGYASYTAPSPSLGFETNISPQLYSQQYSSMNPNSRNVNYANMGTPLSFSGPHPQMHYSGSSNNNNYNPNQQQRPPQVQYSSSVSYEHTSRGLQRRPQGQGQGRRAVTWTPPMGSAPDWDPRKIAREQMKRDRQLVSQDQGTGVFLPNLPKPSDRDSVSKSEGTGVFLGSVNTIAK